MLSAEGLTECKLNQTIQCEHFCCDRRESTRSASFLIRGFRKAVVGSLAREFCDDACKMRAERRKDRVRREHAYAHVSLLLNI